MIRMNFNIAGVSLTRGKGTSARKQDLGCVKLFDTLKPNLKLKDRKAFVESIVVLTVTNLGLDLAFIKPDTWFR